MSRHLLLHLTLLLTLISSTAWGDVGTPCTELADCEPGEVCAPGRGADTSSFCTRSCNESRPCPERYVCESNGGAALCNTELILGGLGEVCDEGCQEGLLCLDDGAERYCSVSCTLPGSCPAGYRCRPGELNACARVTSSASIGSPCDIDEPCLDALECLELPNRDLSYCTYECAERPCPDFMMCEGEGEEARCVHQPYARSLGDTCVIETTDPALSGCEDMLGCEPYRGMMICTQSCTSNSPCPEGFGCQRRPGENGSRDEGRDAAEGRCLPNVISDPDLKPIEMSGTPAGELCCAETGAGSEVAPNSSGGASSEITNVSSGAPMSGTEDTGCDQLNSGYVDLSLLWLMIALCVYVRRRDLAQII